MGRTAQEQERKRCSYSDRKNKTMKDVRKICRLTEERNFTMQTCRNSWRNMVSITIRHIL